MKKMLSKIAAPVFFLINMLASIQPATAQDTSSFNVSSYLTAPGQNKDIVKQGSPAIAILIVRLINYLALTVGSFAFLAIVVGGFMMVTSGGAEQQISKGKDVLKYAIIGLLVALSAYFITAFVQSIFYEIPTAAPATPST
jgi:hypothetical protein